MRKFSIGTISIFALLALLIAGPVFAGDDDAAKTTTKPVTSASAPASAPTPAPVPPPHSSSSGDYKWSGFSVGASFGYTLANGDTGFNPGPTAASFFDLKPQTLLLHPHGVIGGLQVGWDHQHNYWLFGITADFSGTGVNGSTVENPIIANSGSPDTPPGGSNLKASESLKYLATIRGRIGVIADKRLLFYATGGVAGGRFILGGDTNFTPFFSEDYLLDISRIKVGWTAGGGIEYAFHGHCHVGAEYLYYDFPNTAKSASPNPPNPPFFVVNTWTAKGNIARAVFSYRF
jgi:outer membrane immunogenic protein